MAEQIQATDQGQSSSIVKNLVQRNMPAQSEAQAENENVPDSEIHNEEQSTEENISQESSTQSETSVVTKELAENLGIPKGFIGRPLSEVGKSYRASLTEMNENHQRLITLEANENHQRLITLETNFNELKGQITKKEAAIAEAQATAQVKNELGPMPNSFDEPEKFAAWLEKRDEIREAKILKAIEDSNKKLSDNFKNDPTMLQAQELAAKETEKITLSLLQEGLPKEVKASDLLDAWFDANKEDYFLLVKSGIYLNKPEKFVRDVLNWHNALSYDALKNKKESDILKQIHKKTKENLEKVGKVSKTFMSSQPRNEEGEKPKSISSKIAEKLKRQAERQVS